MSMENFYNQVNRFLKQVYNNLPQHDDVSLSSVHLVHDEVDTDVATIETLTDAMLTDEGRKEWSDVLESRVTELFNGYYGTQITCSNVDHERLTEFSYALAGNCPAEDYDKWFDFEEELKADMNMQEGQ